MHVRMDAFVSVCLHVHTHTRGTGSVLHNRKLHAGEGDAAYHQRDRRQTERHVCTLSMSRLTEIEECVLEKMMQPLNAYTLLRCSAQLCHCTWTISIRQHMLHFLGSSAY